MRRLNKLRSPQKKVLVLGYNESQSNIINALIEQDCLVDHSDSEVKGMVGYDFVISFGFGHILKRDVINTFKCPIFNLHISYLPFNRGAHPNFWAFYDKTPHGVTLHIIDNGVDTGPIVCQKYVTFKKTDDTFFKTYKVLRREMETLFLERLNDILTDQWSASPQKGSGTHHKASDLPKNFSGWHANIESEIKKLHREGLEYD